MDKINDLYPESWKPHLELARERLKANPKTIRSSEFCETIDSHGRCLVNHQKILLASQKEDQRKALLFHRNNPNTRFDDCGFPANRKDRHFALTHEFKSLHRYILAIENGSWCFINGSKGNAKTSLAIRICWELMKKDPCLRPSYISLNSWINSQMPDEQSLSIDVLRKLIVLDDFDKYDFKSEFQGRHTLRLIQHLIDKDYLVIFTANFSVKELIAKEHCNDSSLVLDRVRGKTFSVNFWGNSKR